MKNIVTNLTILLLIMGTILLAACASDSSENSSDKGAEKSDGKETSDEVFTFKSSIQAPQQSNLTQGFDAYLDDIEKESDGRIKFERYYSESLVKAADTANAVGSGIADIALLVPGYTPANNPLGTIESMPALWKDQWTGTRAMLDLYEEFPELRKEYENQGIKVVGSWALPSYYIISTKDVTSFEDIKGQKMIAAGGQSLLADALGAVPVGIVITESFEAMERGAVDGALLGLTSSATYGLQEVAKSVWQIPIGSQAGVVGMNKDKFESLPEDLQSIFAGAAEKNAVDFHNIYQVQGEEAAMQKFLDAGVSMNEPTAEEIEQLQEMAKNSVWENWINGSEREGLPAEKILNRFIEIIAEYDKEFTENGLPK